MKKTIKTAVLLCLTVFILLSAVSCNGFVPFETGTNESNGNGIADILTEKVDGGTRITIKYANSEKEDAVFIIPDEQKESTELKDREIIKVEVIDGYLWVYYTDAPEEPVNVGRLPEEDMPPEETTPEVTTPEITTPEITTPEQTTPEIPPVVEPDYNLPEKIDMQGYTYKAYVRKFAGTDPDPFMAQINNGNNHYECIDFWVDEENSEADAISYAVYQRNKKIEEDYNCKIRQVSSEGSQIEHLLAAYMNGEGYDLTIITAKPAAQAATQNLLRNLKDMPYLDLTHEAYDQNSINELSVADKLYFISGDMNISTMEVAGLSIVNMEFYEEIADSIVEEFDGDTSYADIYNIVADKKWTMETMLKIAMLANVDAGMDGGELHVLPNGMVYGTEVDNKYPGGDIVGYHQYLYSALWYFYGSGGRITAKNDEGIPELVIGSDTAQTLYDYIFDKFNRKINAPWIPHESANILNMNFLTGDVLFADMSLFNIRTEIYPYAEFEYGILPNPVYEEGMDYQSVVYFNNWVHLWAIPSLTNNTEYAERMMQIMATYSSLPDSTMSAYYDRTICFTAAPNNGSRDVMDIIRTSMIYDLALLYPSWGGIESELVQIPNKEVSEYAYIKDCLDYIIPQIEATVEQLLNPEAGY